MNKLLLYIIFISLLGFVFANQAKAADSVHIVLKGKSRETFSVMQKQSSVINANINPFNGNFTDTIICKFQTTSNMVNYKVHVSATTQTFPAMSDNGTAGNIIIAFAQNTVSSNNVANALRSNPSVDNNIDVIAYHVTVKSQNGSFEKFNGTDIVATIPTTNPNLVTLIFNNVVPNTYSTYTDTAGTYTSIITCTTSDL